ncbi:MAG: hypothetical protein N0C90_18150, partial [Candidatus Thiodiazotropha endolucinida]|nr:hypothetical protein [Candidatus Thiodiazotropha taylori]MCW4263278.1 hypothetical protein [Candidatus Thiodiazotropha endolucinida]
SCSLIINFDHVTSPSHPAVKQTGKKLFFGRKSPKIMSSRGGRKRRGTARGAGVAKRQNSVVESATGVSEPENPGNQLRNLVDFEAILRA